jgi:hypothetical protein
MARTIHDTWGVAHRARQADWSDPAIPKAIAKEMRNNWLRQQSIRRGERHVRQRGELPPQPVHPMQLPILICGSSPPTPVALYLKLQALDTLVHEVAHHFDFTFRRGRNRWSLGRPDQAGSFDEAKLRELEDRTVTGHWARRIRATTPLAASARAAPGSGGASPA